MSKKIVITGPESSGKTTLAKSLAEQLNCKWLPEFAREYLENNGANYTFDDVILMAKEQFEREYELSKKSDLVILDTNLLVYKIWIEEKYNQQIDWIEQAVESSKMDLYLLCDIDIPWENDPLREHPKTHDRQRLFNKYLNYLQTNEFKFTRLSDSAEQRLKKALNFVQQSK